MAVSDYLNDRGREFARERGSNLASLVVDQCDAEYQELFATYIQNGMYARSVFPQATRELLAVACLTVLNYPKELATHIRYALRLAPREQVMEAILQAGVYGGIPASVAGLTVYAEVIEALDASNDS
jgi:alkylhydroperoxidase/carboxymuconolactone decarboxylase family protein YurZ